MTTTTLTEPTAPQSKGLVGGEPVIMSIGEHVCTLPDGRELRLVHTPRGYEVTLTQPQGHFPIQTLMDGDAAHRFPEKGSAIAQIWKLVADKGEGIRAVSPDRSLLPHDSNLLKQIIGWLSPQAAG